MEEAAEAAAAAAVAAMADCRERVLISLCVRVLLVVASSLNPFAHRRADHTLIPQLQCSLCGRVNGVVGSLVSHTHTTFSL